MGRCYYNRLRDYLDDSRSLSRPLERIVSGLLLGFLQWLVLRRHYQGVYWWIVVSGLSWAAGELASQWVVQSPFSAVFSSSRELIGLLFMVRSMAHFQAVRSPISFRPAQNFTTAENFRTVENRFLASWVAMNAVGWSIGFGSFGQTLCQMFIIWTSLPSSMILDKTFLHPDWQPCSHGLSCGGSGFKARSGG